MLIECVDQLHHRRDGGVEVAALADVAAYFREGAMHCAPHLGSGTAQALHGAGQLRVAHAISLRLDQAIEPAGKAVQPFDALGTPLQVFLRRRREQGVQARRVRTIPLDEVHGVDAVVFRLRHLLDRGDERSIALRATPVAVRFVPVVAGRHVAMLDAAQGERVHHALGDEPPHRLVKGNQAEVAHRFGPEAKVEQMHHRVLGAADVDIDGQPGAGLLAVERPAIETRRHKTRVVPGGVDKGVHGLAFALARAAALRAAGGVKGRQLGERRAAGAGQLHGVKVGQHHRQIFLRHRHRSVFVAVNDRDRRAPVALAREAPIAQMKMHAGLAEALSARLLGHPAAGRRRGEAGERARIAEHAVVRVSRDQRLRERRAIGREDHGLDGQLVLDGELEVALIVPRHRHHCTGAVIGEHKVGEPHRHLVVGVRVHRVGAGEHALFFGACGGPFDPVGPAHALDKGADRALLPRFSELHGQLVLGSEHDVGAPVDGVEPGGEHVDQLARARERAVVVVVPERESQRRLARVRLGVDAELRRLRRMVRIAGFLDQR